MYRPKCPDCGTPLIKDMETIGDWWCPACDVTWDVEELEWPSDDDAARKDY